MKREIKFRVKSPNGNWIFAIDHTTASQLQHAGLVEAIKNGYPICQYSGLSDRNGVEIFENDIIEGMAGIKFPVVFQDGCFMWNNEPLCYDMNDTENPVYLPVNWATVL